MGIVVAIVFAVLGGLASFAERGLVNVALIAGVIRINSLPLAIVILLPFSHPVVLAMKVCAVVGLVLAVGT